MGRIPALSWDDRHIVCSEKEGVNRSLGLLALAGALVMPAVYSLTRPDPQEKAVLTLMSDPYRLDKIYRSMEGPWSIQRG
ncbi:MAG TPA: hypothetical protein VHQ95_00685, partial [Pyrinomonadaceae bacterium]|nr:hypothetical protein [Pyrinomonadaceae bacterium]